MESMSSFLYFFLPKYFLLNFLLQEMMQACFHFRGLEEDEKFTLSEIEGNSSLSAFFFYPYMLN